MGGVLRSMAKTASGSLGLFGPVMFFDLVRHARRRFFFAARIAYLIILVTVLGFVHHLWADSYPNGIPREKLATFAESFFYAFLLVQFAVAVLFTPAVLAGAITDEKERRTLDYLLATDLNSSEILFGKLTARLLNLMALVLTGLPVLSLMTLIGGIDPDMLWKAVLITLVTVLSCAGVSLLLSVRLRRSRDAILLAYLLIIGYAVPGGVHATLLNPGNEWTVVGPNRPAWMGEVVRWLCAANPFTVLFYYYSEILSGVALGVADPTWDYLVAHLAIAITLPAIAVTALRRRVVARPERARAAERSSTVLQQWSWTWPRPRVGDELMLWKELWIESGMRFRVLGRTIVLLLFLFLVAQTCAFLIDVLTNPAGFRAWAPLLGCWLRVVGSIVAVVALLGVAVRAAGSLNGEQEKQTLDGLLTSPLAPWEIVISKWLGSVLGPRWAGIWLAGSWLQAACSGAVGWFSIVPLTVTWLIAAGTIAAWGIWCSTYFSSSLKATLWSLAGTVIALVAQWPLEFLLSIWSPEWGRLTSVGFARPIPYSLLFGLTIAGGGLVWMAIVVVAWSSAATDHDRSRSFVKFSIFFLAPTFLTNLFVFGFVQLYVFKDVRWKDDVVLPICLAPADAMNYFIDGREVDSERLFKPVEGLKENTERMALCVGATIWLTGGMVLLVSAVRRFQINTNRAIMVASGDEPSTCQWRVRGLLEEGGDDRRAQALIVILLIMILFTCFIPMLLPKVKPWDGRSSMDAYGRGYTIN